MRKFLDILMWVFLAASIVASLVFVNYSKKQLINNNIEVKIKNTDKFSFVNELEIKELINSKNKNPLEIENLINNHPSIELSQVYKTIKGDLVVEVIQREPIARIFAQKESYYIDDKGKIMPLSPNYTAHVPVVTGNIKETYSKFYKLDLDDLQNDSIKDKMILDDIYSLMHYVHQNPFWKSQIEQVFVNKDLEIELIPKVGNHRIVFGEVQYIDKKFNKLLLFYKKGLSKTGWNEYATINLKFNNQVVCTKIYN